jgi:ABC-type multidrug transport system ATPase subunit
VDNVYLECAPNSVIALLGHNGAGKSTLINLLIGLLAPNKGTAFIQGKDITLELDEIRQTIGYCP